MTIIRFFLFINPNILSPFFKTFVAKYNKFQGYLPYKSIFFHKVALDVQFMNFFIWRKNNVLFSRYIDFCVFVKSTNFKICDVIIDIADNGSYVFAYCFWILRNIKMKFGQILIYRITNISNMLLAQCWRLETSSRPFYDFNEMPI